MRERSLHEVPLLRGRWDEFVARLGGRPPAVFLDYDGVLSPIVEDPASAVIDDRTRTAVARLARVAPVAVVSGRDADDVRERVGVPGLVVAGSHGFDIIVADGSRARLGQGSPFLAALDAAEGELRAALAGVEGAEVDRKRYAVAVHHRRVDEGRVGEVDDAVAAAQAAHPGLRRTGGKQVMELRPDVDWDKGRAALALLAAMGDAVAPVYVGDDLTDEDAFRAIAGRGIGVVVRGEDDHPTVADYALEDPAEVPPFLDRLTDLAAGATVESD